MKLTVRTIGKPGLVRYTHVRTHCDIEGPAGRWSVEGCLYGLDNQWIPLMNADSEEHALLAVLVLSEGGAWKVNGNILTDDGPMPRKHGRD